MVVESASCCRCRSKQTPTRDHVVTLLLYLFECLRKSSLMSGQSDCLLVSVFLWLLLHICVRIAAALTNTAPFPGACPAIRGCLDIHLRSPLQVPN
jgi:hypothetical protein